jgi:hypothetical protein
MQTAIKATPYRYKINARMQPESGPGATTNGKALYGF